MICESKWKHLKTCPLQILQALSNARMVHCRGKRCGDQLSVTVLNHLQPSAPWNYEVHWERLKCVLQSPEQWRLCRLWDGKNSRPKEGRPTSSAWLDNRRSWCLCACSSSAISRMPERSYVKNRLSFDTPTAGTQMKQPHAAENYCITAKKLAHNSTV